MELEPRQSSRDKDPDPEHRVRLTSKRRATQLLDKGSEVLRSALDGQPELPEESRRAALQQLRANFEAAVKLNVLVDGQPWDDAPDLQDEEDLDLESLLDDTILETTKRRRLYPRRILPHVVQALKAERKILGFYKTSIQPEDIQKDPDQESLRRHLSAAAPAMVRQAFQVMKSINTLQKQAEGLCQVLNMKPSSTSLQINGEVLGSSCQAGAPPPAGGAMRSRRPLKRAMREAAVAEGYWPRTTEPEGSVGEDEAEERFLS